MVVLSNVIEFGINELFAVIADRKMMPWPWALAPAWVIFLIYCPDFLSGGQGGQASAPWCLLSTSAWNQNQFKNCLPSPFKPQVLKPSSGFYKAKGFQSLGFLSQALQPMWALRWALWREWQFPGPHEAPWAPTPTPSWPCDCMSEAFAFQLARGVRY